MRRLWMRVSFRSGLIHSGGSKGYAFLIALDLDLDLVTFPFSFFFFLVICYLALALVHMLLFLVS